MKIENSRPVSKIKGAAVGDAKPAARESALSAVRKIVNDTSIMGISEAELTPKVREAIIKLMDEVESLRRELEGSKARINYLEQLADQDTLAPVANRRAFIRELSRIMSFSERYGSPSSVIYLDLNGLKEINDKYSHAAGDAALVQVANSLLQNVRGSDVVGRLGGDEFGVLLSHADESAATDKATSLMKVIANAPLDWEGNSIPLSVAFGVYTFHRSGDAGDALNAADRNMYARKQGRTQSES